MQLNVLDDLAEAMKALDGKNVGWQIKSTNKTQTQTTGRNANLQHVGEATQHYAESRDPPSQNLRDHIEQVIKA